MEWEQAYKNVCQTGLSKTHRAKLTLIGYKKAGKTSLGRRLLGQPFLDTEESTEGIHTQLIQTTFDSEYQTIGPWKSVEVNADEIVREFNEQVLAMNKTETARVLAVKETNKVRQSLKDSKNNEGLQNIVERGYESCTGASTKTGADQSTVEASLSENQEIEQSNIQIDELCKLLKRVLKSEAEDNFKCLIRLWDHGGRFEFFATHCIFLEAEAVYLIVMDITKELHDVIPSKFDSISSINAASIPETPAQFLDYWISAILNKITSAETVPALAIVLTHKDHSIGFGG